MRGSTQHRIIIAAQRILTEAENIIKGSDSWRSERLETLIVSATDMIELFR